MSHLWLVALVALPLLLALRIYLVLPSPANRHAKTRKQNETCSLGVFLGSGGHTSEMRTLLFTMDFKRYAPRTYIYCHGDDMSLRAMTNLEAEKAVLESTPKYKTLGLPRARRVGQPLLSTLISSLHTFLVALYHVLFVPLISNPFKPVFDILLMNGPGTCVVLVAVSYIRRILGLPHTRIIYVESFARVNTLSLSAKILKRVVDVFVVQWPDLAVDDPRVTYKGWLV